MSRIDVEEITAYLSETMDLQRILTSHLEDKEVGLTEWTNDGELATLARIIIDRMNSLQEAIKKAA